MTNHRYNDILMHIGGFSLINKNELCWFRIEVMAQNVSPLAVLYSRPCILRERIMPVFRGHQFLSKIKI